MNKNMNGFFRKKTHFIPKLIANPDGSIMNYLQLQQQHMQEEWTIEEKT
ncbi:hypothetical protein [Ekhidna sp. To15]